MNIKKSIGARVVGFSHIDNILASLEQHILDAAPDGGRILDIGCGEMHISSQMARRLGDGYDLVASDINPNKLKDPTKELYNPEPNLSPATADATNLPYQSNSFHATYSTSFFSHVHSHDAALEEKIRVTKPGGYLIVLDENLLSPYQLYKWLSALGPEWIRSKDEPEMLEVRGFEYLGVNENHYTPRYWETYISKHPSISLETVTSPRVEQDSTLEQMFSLPVVSDLYTLYETHTVVVAKVAE